VAFAMSDLALETVIGLGAYFLYCLFYWCGGFIFIFYRDEYVFGFFVFFLYGSDLQA
jgi:hypothetical protein